jgi:putative transposase
MFLPTYTRDELKFAYTYRVYLRWQTYRLRHVAGTHKLSRSDVRVIGAKYGIRILRAEWDDTDFIVMASLKPTETVSACASKLKGQLSKRLREFADTDAPILGKGYFACTLGENTEDAVEKYLARQDAHHGYANRVRSPVLTITPNPEANHLQPAHARAYVHLHVVLVTWGRKGVFASPESRPVFEHWESLQEAKRFVIRKASFLPDHVHLAIQIHPSVNPSALVTDLMNAAQDLMHHELPESLIRAGVDRLWQPSAYFGSFGQLREGELRKYLDDWRDSHRAL